MVTVTILTAKSCQHQPVSTITLKKFFVLFDADRLESGYKLSTMLKRLHGFHATHNRIRRLRFYLPSFFSESNARLKAKSIRLDQELGWEGWDQGLA